MSCGTTARCTKGEDEDGENDPSGAGAASGREDETPRAKSRRGGDGRQSTGFKANIGRIRENASASNYRQDITPDSLALAITLGEFAASARWATTNRSDPVPTGYIEFARAAFRQDNVATDETPLGSPDEGDVDLGPLLGAIAEDAHRIAAAVRTGILADFAARTTHARRHTPRHLLAGALTAIKQARLAALAAASMNAKNELKGRMQAAIASRRRVRLRPVRPGSSARR
jgi:hypothetical protein